MNATASYFEVLGVSEDSCDSDVKKAWRSKVREHHPDRGGDPEMFDLVQRAYRELSTEQGRRSYSFRCRTSPTGSAGSAGSAGQGSSSRGFDSDFARAYETVAREARRQEQMRERQRRREAQEQEAARGSKWSPRVLSFFTGGRFGRARDACATAAPALLVAFFVMAVSVTMIVVGMTSLWGSPEVSFNADWWWGGSLTVAALGVQVFYYLRPQRPFMAAFALVVMSVVMASMPYVTSWLVLAEWFPVAAGIVVSGGAVLVTLWAFRVAVARSYGR